MKQSTLSMSALRSSGAAFLTARIDSRRLMITLKAQLDYAWTLVHDADHHILHASDAPADAPLPLAQLPAAIAQMDRE